jgi:hypothetical protein
MECVRNVQRYVQKVHIIFSLFVYIIVRLFASLFAMFAQELAHAFLVLFSIHTLQKQVLCLRNVCPECVI